MFLSIVNISPRWNSDASEATLYQMKLRHDACFAKQQSAGMITVNCMHIHLVFFKENEIPSSTYIRQ